MVEELRPTELPLAFGVLFFLLLHPAPFKQSTRAFADSAEELPRGLAQRRLPMQASASFLAGRGRMSLMGGEGQLLPAVILFYYSCF